MSKEEVETWQTMLTALNKAVAMLDMARNQHKAFQQVSPLSALETHKAMSRLVAQMVRDGAARAAEAVAALPEETPDA